MKVAVFGLGYVGTLTAACLAANGHEVWGVDVDPLKVEMIRDGRSPVQEPGLTELVSEVVKEGSLHATTRPNDALDRADISLVCVGTPSSGTGAAQMTFIERAVTDIASWLAVVEPPASGFHALIVRSTIPVGTVDGLVSDVIAAQEINPSRVVIGPGMCPEFLREGTGLADFYAPPFVVIGADDPRVAESVESLFGFLGQPVQTVPVRAAESLKYTCNAFHALKVSFANEVGRLLRELGVDSREVMQLFVQDKVLNIAPTYLRPGFAFGGSCLPKDLRSMLYMARMNSIDLPLLAGTLATNEVCIRDVVDRVIADGARKVAIFGLSFKMNSDDLRESPYVEVAERLIGKGFDVRIYDAIVNPATLIGTNRVYVESKMPHLRSLLTDDPVVALADSDLAIVASNEDVVIKTLLDNPPATLIDLSGRLGPEIESLPGYMGVAW
jgi:GDP-mannose 6-dehydrogenase